MFNNLLCERGDIIDNAIYNMILEITGKTDIGLPWDMSIISPIADAAQSTLASHGIHICRPYYEGDDEIPCYKVADCECAACPMR